MVSWKQNLAMVAFILGASLAGLAAIHYIWVHPAVIGPFALPIGMTPLVLLFQYSIEIPGYFCFLGAILAITSWFMVQSNPPRYQDAAAVTITAGSLLVVSAVGFIVASAYYNVGMAGEIPAGWVVWVRPACWGGDIGLLLLPIGLLLMLAAKRDPRPRGVAAARTAKVDPIEEEAHS